MNDYENLAQLVQDKQVVVTNTYEEGSFAFYLAHIVRNHAGITYCVDPRYKMRDEPDGVRRIEDGKVFLIRGDYFADKDAVTEKIKSLGGIVDLEVLIK